MKITCIAVNWWGEDYARLLINSVKKYTKNDYEIIIVDNSGELPEIDGVKIIKPESNLGHGAGMDLGIMQATGDYILALDIDAHLLYDGWDELLLEEFKDDKLAMIGADGGHIHKPVRPLFMFFKKDIFNELNLSFVRDEYKGAIFDIGVLMVHQILTKGYKILRMPAVEPSYDGVLGNDYVFNDIRLVYHQWYGTRWYGAEGKRVHDVIDGRDFKDYQASKSNLLNQTNEKFNSDSR